MWIQNTIAFAEWLYQNFGNTGFLVVILVPVMLLSAMLYGMKKWGDL